MLGFLYSKLRRITTNQLYFPEIDGIRFLAIIMVILFHAHGYFRNKAAAVLTGANDFPVLDTILSGGHYGVQLFFVLSGYILCLPFAQQYINNGKKVNLNKYYLRRVTRLEPPYFIAIIGLFFMSLAMGLYTPALLFKSMLASLVYLHEIIFRHSPYLTVVAWSLEIEIQFYVLAPLLFKVLKLNPVLRRTILLAAIIGIVFLQQTYRLPFTSLYNYAQYFMAGILLSDFYVSGWGHRSLNTGVFTLAGLLFLTAILCMPFMNWHYEKFLFPFLIMGFYLIVMKNDIVKRVFSYKFIPIIGGMCYSIYLLHYPIISMFGRFTIGFKLTNHYLPNLVLQIILLTIPVLIISSVYYYFIERPFMSSKWMDKLMKKSKREEPINPVSVPGAD